MVAVRKQKGDTSKVTKNGNIIVTRANGNVVKINTNNNTVIRTKANGTVVRQTWTGTPTAALRRTGSAYGPTARWNIEMPRVRKTPTTNSGGR